MSKLLLAPSALMVAAALFTPVAMAQTPAASDASTLKCSDLAGLSVDESHDLVIYIAGYQRGLAQGQGAGSATTSGTTATAPAATTATTPPADNAMAANTATPAAAPSKLAQLVGLGVEPQAIVTACGSTPDMTVVDVITSNSKSPTP
ncbi:MAG: hypothetical protein JWQ89_4243 [Devosia sp.]|uniref:hypothetical protein n=1 Tax=Devosia sp. TaxID=1871048 RepID=UPI00260FAB86|nr:hypothetical protein [Devosia sp.]MDB5542516.1 hypothetical protein [Devosia sp.]